VSRWGTIMEQQSMTGDRIAPLLVENLGAADIDTQASLDLAELMVGSGAVPWMVATADVSPGSHRRPRLLVLDFDGVLTDNRVWVNETGEESVAFNRGDGMGISMLRDAGVVVAVLSTEENAVVAARCAKLRVPFLQGLADKCAALEQLVDDHALDLADTAYVGNDVNDLGCMQIVGLAIAVADAHPEVLARAHITLSRAGGDGAVREACDMLLSFEP